MHQNRNKMTFLGNPDVHQDVGKAIHPDA